MRKVMGKHLFIILGWFFVVLGTIGIFLPVFPTTPFLIVALACFSKSSPRFHQMLLSNRRFGPILREWENSRTIARRTKYQVSALIILAFAFSIFVFQGNQIFQISLLALGIILLGIIWRIRESSEGKEREEKI